MGDRLIAYSQDTYEERLVSWPGEGRCEITLPGRLLGRAEDFRLELEVRDGVPAFLPGRGFSLRPAGGRRRFPLPVAREGAYFLAPDGGGRLVLLVRAESAAPVVRRFPLKQGVPFRVGAAPDNQIVYHGGGTVSGVHAVFTRTEEGCLLEDLSRNGVYVEGRRINGSRLLRPGSRVHLCGLTLTCLDGGVSLDVSTPGLAVQAGLEPLPESADGQGGGPMAGGDSEDETVFERLSDSEDETVFEDCPDSEDETVFERNPDSEDKTVFEGHPDSEDETVFEGLPDSEDETVFERNPDSEDETIFESRPDSEDETVFERLPDSEDKTVFEGPLNCEDKTDGLPDSEDETVFEPPYRA